MLPGLIVLLVCQLVGELAVRAGNLPLPGPILGMLLMLGLLRARRPRAESALVTAPETLLHHLPLLYVPAGVGVVAYLSRLGRDALPVAGGLVISWLAGLVVTAGVTALVMRLSGMRRMVR